METLKMDRLESMPNKYQPIEFVQYLRPDGRRSSISIERPVEIAMKAAHIKYLGYEFSAEVLNSGQVSFTVQLARDRDSEPIAWELCRNDDEVLQAVDRLVEKASQFLTASLGLPTPDGGQGDPR